MVETANKAQQQDEACSSKSVRKIPKRETEEHTLITITTDSQTTDVDDPTNKEENIPETGEVSQTDELQEVYAPPPTTTANRTLSAQTPMPTSTIGCVTAHSARTNGRDLTATPTRPSYDTAETAEEVGVKAGRGESKNTVSFKEKNNIRRSSRIRTAKRVKKRGKDYF